MKLKPQYRFFSTKDITVDPETRTMEFSFSSEQPVRRWFGQEILAHDSKSADFTRLNDSANVLFNHNPDVIVGVVESAQINSDKRAYAKIRFSKNAKAQEIMQDVQDGIIKNVSFGYEVREMKMTKSDSEKGDVYTATDWMPFEVSFVSIPADQTVGVGREMDGVEKEVNVIEDLKIENETKKEGDIPMPNENPVDTKQIASEAALLERTRYAKINELGDKFNRKELARQLIESGKTIDEARAAFLEAMGSVQVPVTGREGEIGLSEKEVKEFSIVRAINALANPRDRSLQEAAKFEFEASKAAAELAGKASRGVMVPMEVLRAKMGIKSKRDLLVGTASAGGDLVASDLMSASFIDLLRNKSALSQAGIQTLAGMQGNFSIPAQTGSATAYWVGENSAATESQQVVGQVAFSPKTISAYTDYSRKFLIQSSIDGEAFVRNDLALVLALGLDLAGLYGLGSSNQPQGLKPKSINTVDFAAATPTFAELVQMETEIATDNADIGSMAYITNASMRGDLKSAQKVSGQAIMLWENNQLNGYSAFASNQVASGDIFMGVWSQLILAMWSGLDVMVDPYTGSKEGTTRVIVFQDCDYGVRHVESFCRGNNTL